MADSKITALTSIGASTDPANDPLVLVDVSDTSMAATGTTKKVTLNQLLGASGTATLASATITGDLTVDTNVLKVDSANNRVGIVKATPAYPLDVGGRISYSGAIGEGADTTISSIGTSLLFGNAAGWADCQFFAGGNSQHRIQSAGVFTWYDGAGGTRMTLNSTGLGVGGSPSYKLDVAGPVMRLINSAATADFFLTDSGTTNGNVRLRGESNAMKFITGGGVSATIDSSGNVGVGVTPSAWSGYKSIGLSNQGCNLYALNASSTSGLTSNAYYNGTNWLYINSQASGRYEMVGSAHSWFRSTDVTPTAGNAITFTQAMTLDASGNLLVGTTGLNATWNTRLTLSSDSGTTRWAVGPYSTATNFVISGASGGGVYLNGTAATSWTSASDERLKDIIEPIGNAVAKVGSLRAVIGKFKNDALNTRKSFLIAQDVQSVLPEAVDASNPDQLGVAYTDVIPLLVAAIKELTARVEALEA